MRQSMTRPTRAELARHAPALACYFFLTLAVESSTTPLALVRNRALAWDETPEGANRFYAFVFAVATLKPLYASVSDRSRARGGTRAAHVALGCAVALAGALSRRHPLETAPRPAREKNPTAVRMRKIHLHGNCCELMEIVFQRQSIEC